MGTVSKAMLLLRLFDEERLTLRLSEVVRLTGYDKATAHRSLQELSKAGMLEQIGPDRAYRVGPEVLRLANVREATVPLLACAKPLLQELSEFTGETTHLSIVRRERLVRVAHEYSDKYAMGIMMGGTDSHPLHATSSGLAVLAFSPDNFLSKILSGSLDRYTQRTLVTVEEIKEVISSIRKFGFSESNGAFELDVYSFSAPIFDWEGQAFGAISITAPSARVKATQQKEFPIRVMEAAEKLTKQTGGKAPRLNWQY